MTNYSIAAPIINNNGSDKQFLMNQLLEAVEAVYKAQNAFGACVPNGRDYQPYGAHADLLCTIARDQHEAEMRKLMEVASYIQHLSVAINKQGR